MSETQEAGLNKPVQHWVKKVAQVLEAGQLCEQGIHAGGSPADKPATQSCCSAHPAWLLGFQAPR